MASLARVLLLSAVLLVGFLSNPGAAWSPYHDPHMESGRSVIVQMFEWRFDDIADECEKFLGPSGYGGVQVSPPANEHAIVMNGEIQQPWYQRYQTVSYKLDSRSGTRAQLQDMVRRCNNAGVRIYVDTIMNHMTANMDPSIGSAGSKFNGNNFEYPDYNVTHFNSKTKCGTEDGQIHHYDDFWESRNCELVGLHDLDQSQEHVKQKLTDHVNDLIDMGVAGFRVDASKHMYPEDLLEIFSRAKFINRTLFGPSRRPFVYHEVSDGDGSGIKPEHYFVIGRVLNFPYRAKMNQVMYKENGMRLAHLRNFGKEWGLGEGEDAVPFIDNHDHQRNPMPNLSFRNQKLHKIATAFLLSWPYGFPKIMSSYDWHGDKTWMGPPSFSNFTTKHVAFNGEQCTDGWICEHRWPQISRMVKWRAAAGAAPVDHWWDNQGHQIAFSRRAKAFIAINNDDSVLDQWLQTGLPAGNYCDIMSGDRTDDGCTGRTIKVEVDGKAWIQVPNDSPDPIIALHVNAKL